MGLTFKKCLLYPLILKYLYHDHKSPYLVPILFLLIYFLLTILNNLII